MKLTFGGQIFELHTSGALYWPKERMLIVSDLHLEKGSHFALRGFFLPPYDSLKTLSILNQACLETECHRLMLLGDAFHDVNGYKRLGNHELALFDSLQSFNPIWIVGNHDGDFVPPGFTGMMNFTHNGITFRHEALSGDNAFEISGHYHPKADIRYRGSRISRPCYIEDGQKLILPAFGAYTGGLSALSPPISNLFENKTRIYMLGERRVYRIDDESAA